MLLLDGVAKLMYANAGLVEDRGRGENCSLMALS